MRNRAITRTLAALALSAAPLSCTHHGSQGQNLQATTTEEKAEEAQDAVTEEIFGQARTISVYLGKLNTIRSNNEGDTALEYVYSDKYLQVNHRFRITEDLSDNDFSNIEVRYLDRPVFDASRREDRIGLLGDASADTYVPGRWEEYLSNLHTFVALPAKEQRLAESPK